MKHHTHKRAKEYAAGNYRLYFFSTVIDFMATIGFITLLATPLSEWVHHTVGATYLQTSLYAVAMLLFFTVVGLPLSFHAGYRREHRFGLSNQTVAGWWQQKGKGFLLSLLFAPLVVAALYWTLKMFPNRWWLVLAGLAFLFSLILSRLAPILILPLFYKTEPLEPNALTERIHSLATDAGLSISGLFRINLSKNSKKLNAALTGLGRSRRVLLGDTLLAKMTDDEVIAVFAHEVGHHARRHIPRLIAFHTIGTIMALFICHLVVGWVTEPPLARLETIPLIALVLGGVNFIARPIGLAFSRKLEVESDRYALEKTKQPEAFVRCMRKLADENLADDSPSPLAEWFFYSHPPISKRIALAAGMARSNLSR